MPDAIAFSNLGRHAELRACGCLNHGATDQVEGVLLKYSKITGSMLHFKNGQRIDTGISYASQDFDPEKHTISIRTHLGTGTIETVLTLEGPDFLNYQSRSDDARIPIMKGRFWNLDYEDCVLSATLSGQNIKIDGVVTKLDPTHVLSTKTLTDSSGNVVGIVQERVELISESEFRSATKK